MSTKLSIPILKSRVIDENKQLRNEERMEFLTIQRFFGNYFERSWMRLTARWDFSISIWKFSSNQFSWYRLAHAVRRSAREQSAKLLVCTPAPWWISRCRRIRWNFGTVAKRTPILLDRRAKSQHNKLPISNLAKFWIGNHRKSVRSKLMPFFTHGFWWILSLSSFIHSPKIAILFWTQSERSKWQAELKTSDRLYSVGKSIMSFSSKPTSS